MGVESTTIAVRAMLEPGSLGIPASEVLAITAMTGDEHEDTGALMERFVLPLMREHGMRYVQTARHGYSSRMGVNILSDTSAPQQMFMDGDYALSTELLTNGIVPMTGTSMRNCSAKQKGKVIEQTLDILGVTQGPYDNILGFAKGEERRAKKGSEWDLNGRESRYPLIDWGWTRDDCLLYLADTFGVMWPKSACVYCPYAFREGDSEHILQRLLARPESAIKNLDIEYGARCVNPTQTLLIKGALYDLLKQDQRFADIIRHFDDHVFSPDNLHSVFDVRRVIKGSGKGKAWRSMERLATGSRIEMEGALQEAAAERNAPVVTDEVTQRAWVRSRGMSYPRVEQSLLIAPAVIANPGRAGFNRIWEEALQQLANRHEPSMAGMQGLGLV